jgi:hypothetical protein
VAADAQPVMLGTEPSGDCVRRVVPGRIASSMRWRSSSRNPQAQSVRAARTARPRPRADGLNQYPSAASRPSELNRSRLTVAGGALMVLTGDGQSGAGRASLALPLDPSPRLAAVYLLGMLVN